MAKRRRGRLAVRGWWRTALVLAVTLAAGYVAWELLTLPEAAPLAAKAPGRTALMQQREREARQAGKKVRHRQQWVPLSRVPKVAVSAILVSEDSAFYRHEGVDTRELQKALEEAWKEKRLTRGASTISQQLAKNLWLSTDRSLLRKLKELILTGRLEADLSKARILELYVNVVEWGDGVYGIEAAAKEHFGLSAAALSPAQAAVLAGMLPAPRTWLPAKKPARLHRRARIIVDRLELTGALTSPEARSARSELDHLFGKALPPVSTGPARLDTEAEEEPGPPPPGAPAAAPPPDVQPSPGAPPEAVPPPPPAASSGAPPEPASPPPPGLAPPAPAP